MSSAQAEYFDEDGKQIKPMPKKWLDLSRFKVGDRIRYLRDNLIHIPSEECKAAAHFHYHGQNSEKCESRNMRGLVGVVTKVNQGDGRCWPPRFIRDSPEDEGCWIGQRPGWLTVQFEISSYRNKDGSYGPVGLGADDEGVSWEAACEKRCAHDSVCRLAREHVPSDRHESEHDCVFFDVHAPNTQPNPNEGRGRR